MTVAKPIRSRGAILAAWAALAAGIAGLTALETQAHGPNVVLIFADDLGYADLACYGGRHSTPHLDRLAREGIRFTDFHVPQAVCSASRAALLTGCYPNRVSVFGAFGPKTKTALNHNEITIAELLKPRGYATAIFGKWHLGDHPDYLPGRQGFDAYYGLLYSNDMWPHHPTGGANYPPLPLIEGVEVIELMPDQRRLTTEYTARAVRFIERNWDRPFFLYLPHSMPHVPLFVAERSRGKSGTGLYGDVIREIDDSVGAILRTLDRLGLDRQTLVIFTSDNGPWLLYGDHAGSAGGLREGKATSFEGGIRVPMLARWPGKIPPGRTCSEFASTLDLLPTLARLAGTAPPRDRVIDGKDIWPLLSGEADAKSPHEAFYYYWGRELQAVRSGPWKLHLPHGYPKPAPAGGGGKPGRYDNLKIGLSLFNLEQDPGETRDLSGQHPEIVARLEALAEIARDDLGDSAQKRTGNGIRPPGIVPAE